MSTLEGQSINQTYKDLLQVSNSNSGVDGTLRAVEDGEGTVSALEISTTDVRVNNLTVTGTVTGLPSSATNLSTTANSTSLTVNSDTGTNASIPAATTSAWGAMTDEDKTKLDSIDASASVTDATSVQAAGALMDSEITNLAQVKAFDSSNFASSSHSHAWSEITNKPASFTPSSHTHTASQITDFDTSVNSLISSNSLVTNNSGPSSTTTTVDLTPHMISAPSAWSNFRPTAKFSYTITGDMVTVQWFISANSSGGTPLTALQNNNGLAIKYEMPTEIAFNQENSDHLIYVPLAIRTNRTSGTNNWQDFHALGNADVEVHAGNNSTRIRMRVYSINNINNSDLWDISGQVTYPIVTT